jgi:acetyltransferase-like isoleucine patch superfamily enzyme
MPGILSLYRFWQRTQGKLFTLLIRGDFQKLGSRTVLRPPIRLGGVRFIEVGSRVFVGPNSWLEVIAEERPSKGPAISIGDETAITGFCTITAVRNVVIEPKVLMARYVYIADHSHAHASRLKPVKDQGLTKIAPVRICEGAWLGQSVVVCPGVTIGRNAVVGANSVVRSDVPDFCVAAGAPARVIRSVGPEIRHETERALNS